MTTPTQTETAAPEQPTPTVLAWNPEPVKLEGPPDAEIAETESDWGMRYLADVRGPGPGSGDFWRWVVLYENPFLKHRQPQYYGDSEVLAVEVGYGSAATRDHARAACQDAVDQHRRTTAKWEAIIQEAFQDQNETRAAYERVCVKAARAAADAHDDGISYSEIAFMLVEYDHDILEYLVDITANNR